eukprot:9327178-Pyramimonas_sp.AAC.1
MELNHHMATPPPPARVQLPLREISPVFDHDDDGSSHFGWPPTDRRYTFPDMKGELRLRPSDSLQVSFPPSRIPRRSSGGDLQQPSSVTNAENIDGIDPKWRPNFTFNRSLSNPR